MYTNYIYIVPPSANAINAQISTAIKFCFTPPAFLDAWPPWRIVFTAGKPTVEPINVVSSMNFVTKANLVHW